MDFKNAVVIDHSSYTNSSTLAWRIPWTEEPGGLQSMGSLRVGHDWATSLFTFHFHALEKEMATHSSVLAWRIPGTGEPGGLPSMGSHRVGDDWSDLAAAAAAAIHTNMVNFQSTMLREGNKTQRMYTVWLHTQPSHMHGDLIPGVPTFAKIPPCLPFIFTVFVFTDWTNHKWKFR